MRQQLLPQAADSVIRFGGSNIGLAGCGMRLKIEAGCGIREILKAGCRMKTERQDRDMLCFVGGLRDRLGICKIIS